MNSIVKNIPDLLQGKPSLSPPCIGVFEISSSCFFKILPLVFSILVKRDCLAD